MGKHNHKRPEPVQFTLHCDMGCGRKRVGVYPSFRALQTDALEHGWEHWPGVGYVCPTCAKATVRERLEQ